MTTPSFVCPPSWTEPSDTAAEIPKLDAVHAELHASQVFEKDREALIESLSPGAPDFPVSDLAEAFPLIAGEDFEALVADIRAHGVREPITLYAGEILDGRNRVRAAKAAGITTLKTTRFKGTQADALALVISVNLARRHLDVGQRAAIAAELANMVVGGKEANSANLQNCEANNAASPGISQAEAAKALRVSTRSVATAAKVKKVSPALHQQVKKGEVTLNAAAKNVTSKAGPKSPAANKPKESKAIPRPLGDITVALESLQRDIVLHHEAAAAKLDGKSEKWLDSDAGQRAEEIANALEEATGSLEELIAALGEALLQLTGHAH